MKNNVRSVNFFSLGKKVEKVLFTKNDFYYIIKNPIIKTKYLQEENENNGKSGTTT